MATRRNQIYGPHLPGRQRMLFDSRMKRLEKFLTARDRERAEQVMVKEWTIATLLNQMNNPPEKQSHCVGYAWGNHANTRDSDGYTFDLTDADGNRFYYAAVAHGGAPESEDGSTTGDGAWAARSLGFVKTYAFTNNRDDLLTWLLVKGSLVTGIPWYSEMFKPDSTGLIHARGTLEGGHEIEINKVDKQRGRIRLPNTWGPDWGDGGFCESSFDDYFGKLLSPYGDASTAVDNIPEQPPTPEPELTCADYFVPRAWQRLVVR